MCLTSAQAGCHPAPLKVSDTGDGSPRVVFAEACATRDAFFKEPSSPKSRAQFTFLSRNTDNVTSSRQQHRWRRIAHHIECNELSATTGVIRRRSQSGKRTIEPGD